MVAMAAVAGWHGQTLANGAGDDRLESIEQRLRYMEQRLQAQDQVIRDKDQRIAELETTAGADSWLSRIELAGVVEVEAGYSKTDGADATTDLSVATVELGIAAKVNDWVHAETVLLYEGEDLEVDIAQIGIAPPDGGWSLAAGKLYLPFGSFETQMVSDPLTLEMGETGENAVVAGIEANGFSAAAYLFNGTNNKGGADDSKIDNFGVNLGYVIEGDGYGFAAGVGYINDLSDSDTIQDALAANDNVDHVAGWTASATFSSGPVVVIGEYLTAVDPIAGLGGEQPEAWNIEAGYSFAIGSREATVAVGYQGTEQATSLDLPERRMLAALSVEVMKQTSVAVEWARDEAYGGERSNTLTAQLAVEF